MTNLLSHALKEMRSVILAEKVIRKNLGVMISCSMTNSQSLNNRSKAFANTVGFLWFSQPPVWGEGKNKKQLCLPLCGWRWLPWIHMMLPDPLLLKESLTVPFSIIRIHHHNEFANGSRDFLLSRRANCSVIPTPSRTVSAQRSPPRNLKALPPKSLSLPLH